MPSPVSGSAELLAALARGLAVVRAPWYVFGAQAVLIWGRPRFTADVDVTVRLEPEDPDRLIEALATEKFVLRVPDARGWRSSSWRAPCSWTSAASKCRS